MQVVDDPVLVRALHVEVVDGTVSFSSDGDTSADAQIAQQLGSFLATRFQPMGQALPAGVPVPRLVGVVDGAGSAVALPLDLSGQGIVADPGSIGQVFLGSSDFGVAVSREYILSLIQPALDALTASQPTLNVTA